MPKQQDGCISRIIGMFIFAAIIAVSAWLFVFYFGDRESLPEALPQLPNASSIEDLLPDIELFHREDPFSNINPDDANKWADEGNGLELTLINCLDEQWVTYFDTAVSEWDNGTPDALTLTTETGTPETECSAVDGVMKVCNGDYGETDWKGINTVLIESGWITTSSARMNDHFFSEYGEENKRQYTMCHEIGHGFGLPHTDEQFWNRDLGNCLDYTNNFVGNKSPDEFLYTFLADLYGTVDGKPWNSTANGGSSATKEDTTTTGGDDTTNTDTTGDGSSAESQSPSGRRRLGSSTAQQRQYQKGTLFSSVQNVSRRRELLRKWERIEASIMDGSAGSIQDGWRRLHQSEYGISHEIDLDEQFTVQIHKLLA